VSKKRRRHERVFKLKAVARLEKAVDVSELARELGVSRGLLYKWQAKLRKGGPEALRTTGRRRLVETASAQREEDGGAGRRIAELERKVGEQQLELDFFRAALRQVKGRRRPNGGRGGPASTR